MKSLARHIVSQETTKRMLGAGQPFLIAGTCALILAGCSGTIRNVNAVKFDGHYFAGRASKSSVDPHGFSVRIHFLICRIHWERSFLVNVTRKARGRKRGAG